MSSLTKLKLGLTIIGLILFGYGVRVDDTRIRLIGIGFVAAASLLRFVTPRSPSPETRSSDADAGRGAGG